MAKDTSIETGSLKQTKYGQSYASDLLERTTRFATWVHLFPEASPTPGMQLLRCKIGKYLFKDDGSTDIKVLESTKPNSRVILSPRALDALITFLEREIRPLKENKKHYAAFEGDNAAALAAEFKKLIGKQSTRDVLAIIEKHDLLAEDVRRAVVAKDHANAIADFEAALLEDRDEAFWQDWFKNNDWVLGSDFVTILDERMIDVQNQGDYLAKAVDGFLDIIEIKRPSKMCWYKALDHDNYVLHSDLSKAITQGLNYLYQLETEMNNIKSLKRFDDVPIAKPKGLLIHGRSHDWNAKQFLAQRLLNAALTGLQFFTYDQVLQRARRVLSD